LTHGIGRDERAELVLRHLEPETDQHLGGGHEPRSDDNHPPGNDRPVDQPHPRQPVVGGHEALDRTCDNPHTARGELFEFIRTRGGNRVQEQNQVVRPLREQERLMNRERPRREHPDRLVTHFPAVAVRAVQNLATPTLAQTGDVGQFVDQPRRHEQPPSRNGPSAGERHHETVIRDSGGLDAPVDHLAAVFADLASPGLEQRPRRHPLEAEVVVYARGRRVTRLARVDHQHRASRPSERHPAGEPGGTPADHHHVVPLSAPVARLGRSCRCHRSHLDHLHRQHPCAPST